AAPSARAARSSHSANVTTGLRPWIGFAGSSGMRDFSPCMGRAISVSRNGIAADAGPDLAAVVIAAASSAPRSQTYHGDSFSLELALGWAYIAAVQQLRWGKLHQVLFRPKLRRALQTWPLAAADRKLLGMIMPYYQDWLAHSDRDDPYWDDRVFSDAVER